MKKVDFLYLIILTVISLLAVRALFLPTFYESHDGVVHLMRLSHFYQELANGQFPVRWLSTWMAGYGSPIFNFNWSLPYYIGSFFHLVGLSFEASIKAVFILSIAVSAWLFFIFLKELMEDSVAAFVGSVLYIWAPYRFSTIFIRGALGEALAFVFLPLIFLSAYKAIKTSLFPKWTPWVWGLFILTHNTMSFIGAGLFFLYTLIFSTRLKNRLKIIKNAVKVFMGGILLSSFFWLPAIIEKKYDNISHLRFIYKASEHVVPLKLLIYSKWQYGLSVPTDPERSMSFQIGIIHLGIFLIVLLWFVLRLPKRKGQMSQVVFFSGLTIIAILLMTPAAQKLYDLSLISSINNLPWRLLGVVTFSISVLGGIFFSYVKYRKLQLALLISLIVIIVYFPYSNIISPKFTQRDEWYKSSYKTPTGTIPDTEYLPIYANYFGLLETRGEAGEMFKSAQPEVQILEQERRGIKKRATIVTTTEATIEVEQFYFPGWRVWIDGRAVEVKPNEFGLISFPIQEGTHDVRVAFTSTPIRTFSSYLSLIALFYFLKEGLRTGRVNLAQKQNRDNIHRNK